MILVLPPPRIFLLAPQASLSRVARDDVDEFLSLPLLPRFVEIGLLVLLNETPEKHRERLLLKYFEYRRTLGYVGLVCVVRTCSTSLDVHSSPA